MPTVNIFKTEIEEKLGKLTEEEYRDIFFDFGLELDEVTSQYEIVSKEQGSLKAENCSKEIIYKIDIPANRSDLLCVEGLIRALMIFHKKIEAPRYICSQQSSLVRMTMSQSTQKVRQFAVAAILRNITFNKARYDSFISLQDKLHQNIGRKRSVVSIGTHDLDTLEPPFIYDAKRPSEIKFVPLNESKAFTAEELMIHYSSDSHLKAYLPIIKDFEVYPVIYDSRGTVLSLPPIINGDHSKIKLSTKNVFIEITATNLQKANVVLDTMVTMFSEYCAKPFQIEPVEVVQPDGSIHQYPELKYRLESVSVKQINKRIGININADEIESLLQKMSLKATITGSDLSVEVPPTRHDVLHVVDIVEDVAIAYDYNKITGNPNSDTHNVFPCGGIQKISKLADAICQRMVVFGYTEVLTFALCSRDDISTKIGIDISETDAVHIGNPKTKEFQVARTCLLPGILDTIKNNQHLPLPLRPFEVQDVVLKDSSSDVGARNQKRLCGVHYGMEPDFEFSSDVLSTIMGDLGYSYHQSPITGLPGRVYTIEAVSSPHLLTGRSFCVKLADGREIGRVGIIHPTVIKNFGIKKGFASMLEIEIESLL